MVWWNTFGNSVHPIWHLIKLSQYILRQKMHQTQRSIQTFNLLYQMNRDTCMQTHAHRCTSINTETRTRASTPRHMEMHATHAHCCVWMQVDKHRNMQTQMRIHNTNIYSRCKQTLPLLLDKHWANCIQSVSGHNHKMLSDVKKFVHGLSTCTIYAVVPKLCTMVKLPSLALWERVTVVFAPTCSCMVGIGWGVWYSWESLTVPMHWKGLCLKNVSHLSPSLT